MTETTSVMEQMSLELANAWIESMTLSGRLAFERNEARRSAIIARAESLNVWPEVYRRANEIMNGG